MSDYLSSKIPNHSTEQALFQNEQPATKNETQGTLTPTLAVEVNTLTEFLKFLHALETDAKAEREVLWQGWAVGIDVLIEFMNVQFAVVLSDVLKQSQAIQDLEHRAERDASSEQKTNKIAYELLRKYRQKASQIFREMAALKEEQLVNSFVEKRLQLYGEESAQGLRDILEGRQEPPFIEKPVMKNRVNLSSPLPHKS